MPGGRKNTRQMHTGASRDTKTKGKEVINNAFANLCSASDASSSEEEEEEYMEDTIEVAPGAPKAIRSSLEHQAEARGRDRDRSRSRSGSRNRSRSRRKSRSR